MIDRRLVLKKKKKNFIFVKCFVVPTLNTCFLPGSVVTDGGNSSCGPLNRSSHVPRLGLARALARSTDTQDQAKLFYREVIAMAAGVSRPPPHHQGPAAGCHNERIH